MEVLARLEVTNLVCSSTVAGGGIVLCGSLLTAPKPEHSVVARLFFHSLLTMMGMKFQ